LRLHRLLFPFTDSYGQGRWQTRTWKFTPNLIFLHFLDQLYFLYGRFLYGQFLYRSSFIRSKFIRSDFIRSKIIQFKIYTVQNLYGSKFIQVKIYTVQNLYSSKFIRSIFIQVKFYTGTKASSFEFYALWWKFYSIRGKMAAVRPPFCA
jgi:hypothetical protein